MNYNKEFSINLPSYNRDPKGFYKSIGRRNFE